MPDRSWHAVPTAQPGATAVRFPARYRGMELQATATAHPDRVVIEPLAGVEFEVDLDVWQGIAPFMTAAALAVLPPT